MVDRLFGDDRSLTAEIERVAVLLDICERNRDGVRGANEIEPMTATALASPEHWMAGMWGKPGVGDSAGEDDSDESSTNWPLEAFEAAASVGPLRVSMMGGTTDAIALHSARVLSPRAQRGRCRGTFPRAIMYGLAYVDTDGSTQGVEAALALRGDRWRYVDARKPGVAPSVIEAMAEMPIIFMSWIHACRPSQWRVLLGYEGSPTVSFVTDPIGAQEVFALRDLPAGRTRRSALLHWVTEHWRKQNRADAAATIRVREHLRGERAFRWNGLACEVIPASEDSDDDEAKAP